MRANRQCSPRRRPVATAVGHRSRPSIEGLERRALLAVVTPFKPRFQANDTGDIAIIGNTLMTLPDTYPNAAAVRAGIGTGSSLNNNNYNMGFVDVDNNPGTFNSSSATLSLPAGATVLFAGLYWGANSTSPAR